MPQNLTCCQKKIYITDPAIGRVYIVDLDTKDQFSVGRLGNEPGLFKKPTGILVYEVGNFLVSDTGNSSIMLFNKRGDWVYNIEVKGQLKTPMGMLR